MATLNSCNFIGNVGKIETRYTPSGDCVTTISLACNETWKDRDGNKQEKCEWVNVVMWKKLGEIAEKYVKKGDALFVSGKLRTRSYDDRDGNKRYMTEIIADQMQMLGGAGQGTGGERSQHSSQNANWGGQQQGEGQNDPPFNPDDDIPF